MEEQGGYRHQGADLRENIAESHIKGGFWLNRNVNPTGEDALGEWSACGGVKALGELAKWVDETGDPRVGYPDQGPAGLNCSKHGICKVLFGGSGMEKPAIIGDIDQQIGAFQDEAAGQIPQSIFKANQRGDFQWRIGGLKKGELSARREIARNQIAGDPGKERE